MDKNEKMKKKNHSRQWTTGYEVKKKSTNTTPINLGTPTNNLFWHFLFPFRNCSPRIRHAPCSPVYVVGNRVRVVVWATYETMSLPLRSLPPLTSLLLDMPLHAYLASSPSRVLSLCRSFTLFHSSEITFPPLAAMFHHSALAFLPSSIQFSFRKSRCSHHLPLPRRYQLLFIKDFYYSFFLSVLSLKA